MEVDVPTTQEEEAEPYWFLEEDIPIWLDEAMLLRRADLIEDTMKELQAYGQKALYSSIQYRVQVRSALYSINVTSGETNQKINVLHLCRCVQDQLCLGSLLDTFYRTSAKIVKLVIKESTNLLEKFSTALKTHKDIRDARNEIHWSTARKRLHQLCSIAIHRNIEDLRIFVEEFAQPMIETMFEMTTELDKEQVEAATKLFTDTHEGVASQSPTRKTTRETWGNETTNEIPRVQSSLGALHGFCSNVFNSWEDYIDRAIHEDYPCLKRTTPVLLKFLATRQYYNVVKKTANIHTKNGIQIPKLAETYAQRQLAIADMVQRGPGSSPKLVKTVDGDELMCMEERILWVHRSRQKWKADTAPIDASSLYPLVENQALGFKRCLEGSQAGTLGDPHWDLRRGVGTEDYYMFNRPTKLDFVDHVRLMCHPGVVSDSALFGGNDIVDFAFNVAFTG